MAITIITPAYDQSAQSNGTATTIQRIMRAEGETLGDVVFSNIIPQPNSRHPDNSFYWLTERSFSIVGNMRRKTQVQIDLTYTNSRSGGGGGGASDEEDRYKQPWELGATQVSIRTSSSNKPFIVGYNPTTGALEQVLNSAGCRIEAETQKNDLVISFTYCVKGNRTPPVNKDPIINSSNVIVAGYVFAPQTAKLMPLQAELIVDYNSDGTESRRYWNIKAEIIYKKEGHAREFLDVGSLARFKNSSGVIDPTPKPIYQYTPWTSKEINKKEDTRATIGSLDMVIQAKHTYAQLYSSSATSVDYQRAWDELPFNEITEKLPLRADGTVFVEAMKDPIKYPYHKKRWVDCEIVDWARYNLPSKRSM